MIRDIDIKTYVPKFIVNYEEMNEIYSVENKELNKIEQTHWNVIDNKFFVTADENGITRFEKMLNIVPLANDTLETRRFRVMTKWTNILPYNYKYLVSKLVTLCGLNGFSIDLDCNNYSIIVKLELTAQNSMNDVKKLFDEVIPCNIVQTILQLYNTHEKLHKFTHSELSKFTHNGIRVMIIE